MDDHDAYEEIREFVAILVEKHGNQPENDDVEEFCNNLRYRYENRISIEIERARDECCRYQEQLNTNIIEQDDWEMIKHSASLFANHWSKEDKLTNSAEIKKIKTEMMLIANQLETNWYINYIYTMIILLSQIQCHLIEF